MTITVYSKNNCQMCNATVRWFDKRGIDVTYLNIEENPAAHEQAVALSDKVGQMMPIVYREDTDTAVSGFRPDAFAALVA